MLKHDLRRLLKLLFALIVVLGSLVVLLLYARQEIKPQGGAAPSPTPAAGAPAIPRSAALELGEVAPVGTAQPELGWVLEPKRLGWGEVDVPGPPALEPLLARGRALQADLCAPCHGPEGRGDGPFADSLPRPPRDLSGTLRTRAGRGAPSAEELYRTLSVGAPRQGMPAFAHLPPEDRWALAAWVRSLQSPQDAPGAPLALPPRPAGEPDLHLGQDVFRARCAACHGANGAGDTPVAAALRDTTGAPCPPADLSWGPGAFRGGARAADVVRTVLLGRPGTPMVPTLDLSPGQLWALGAYVERLAELGRARRRSAWNAFFAARPPVERASPGAFVDAPERRWSRRRAERYAEAPEGSPAGCLGCHQGIEAIAQGAMAEALTAIAGGDPARRCALCHEGDPEARRKDAAHRGLIANPGSLWVTSVGAGCAQCHSGHGALTTLLGRPLPEAVGGRWMDVRSRRSDPTGATSGNVTYRLQRALMAQETGKVLLVTSSVGLVDPSRPRFSDFPLADPDGAEPCCGSEAYRRLIAQGLDSGYLQRLERSAGVPTFPEALKLLDGDKARAAVVDYGRKACFRCHLWGEGIAAQNERRSAGCSACHVVYDGAARSQSGDPTIPHRPAGHPVRHELVFAVPNQNCNHCHTRNPLTEHSEPHEIAGMACVDCHGSIDLHGDGNAYPSMEHQVEIRCEDCHGSAGKPPWELPLGHGTPLAQKTPRGVHAQGGRDYLLSSRGNPRANWFREEGRVVVRAQADGRRFEAPLLGAPPALPAAGDPPPTGCTEGLAGHEQLSCSLCHNRQAPRCGGCHMTYLPYRPEQDYLLSALFYGADGRQQTVLTPGSVEFEAPPGTEVPFGEPDTRRDRANRWAPREPGCKVQLDYLDEGGRLLEFVPRYNPGSPSYPPVVANTHPHENALPPRGCAECHPQGWGAGQPVSLFGDVQPDRGDWWREEPADHASQAARSRWGFPR